MFLQESSTVKWNSCDAKVRFCYFNQVPRKIRQLVSDLRGAGFFQVPGGKGSHRKFRHEAYRGFVLISGSDGDDAHPYQEQQVRRALMQVKK
jgi:predicted RNA binding protein YcfA (HicA-like mRNA interferase family)